jgi:thiosulfate dehydrogenase
MVSTSAILVGLAAAAMLGASVCTLAASAGTTVAQETVRPAFEPPTRYPDGPFGEAVRFGEQVFVHTQDYATGYVGNGLTCESCHLDRGRLASSGAMWAAYVMYPQYRNKTKRVDTLEDRLRDCFRYSMNGRAPDPDSPQLTGLVSYLSWLATGAQVGARLDGQGFPPLEKPAEAPNIDRGGRVFAVKCAICHGNEGQGRKVGDRYVFPPLWGSDSFNWGAGMHRVATAASFIKANMPFGSGGVLTDQEAWDVATFVDSHPRPQDPRFTGDVAETRLKFHGEGDFYGLDVGGVVLGAADPLRHR